MIEIKTEKPSYYSTLDYSNQPITKYEDSE